MSESLQFRVWWHRRYSDEDGHTAFIPVVSPEEAIRAIEILAASEVGDEMVYMNACGLQVLEGGEWVEWCNEDGESIDEYAAQLQEVAGGGR